MTKAVYAPTPEQLVCNALIVKSEIESANNEAYEPTSITHETLEAYGRTFRQSLPSSKYVGSFDDTPENWDEFKEDYAGILEIKPGESYTMLKGLTPALLRNCCPLAAEEVDYFCNEAALKMFTKKTEQNTRKVRSFGKRF